MLRLKLLCFLMAALLIVAVVGCGTDDTSTVTPGNQTDSTNDTSTVIPDDETEEPFKPDPNALFIATEMFSDETIQFPVDFLGQPVYLCFFASW